MRQKALLKLNNGFEFQAELVSSPTISSGELVFTTGMVGYSEAISDPSYYGQILVFTYPLIGNYGVPDFNLNQEDVPPRGFESHRPQVAGVIANWLAPQSYHWNSPHPLTNWLSEFNIPLLTSIDTRHLVHLIRQHDNLLGRIEPENPESSMRPLDSIDLGDNSFFNPNDHSLLDYVCAQETQQIGKGGTRIGLIDCGLKWNIVRNLLELETEVQLVPGSSNLKDVDCDAWLISNGPGDPTKYLSVVNQIKDLLDDNRPVLGICLGHQLLSLAAGAKTQRLPYGHRGQNHPVTMPGSQQGFLTSQNHGYCVQDNSIPQDWEPWFVHLNDNSIEGIRHRHLPFRSVQFHPEAAGGPRETFWILRQFVEEANSHASI